MKKKEEWDRKMHVILGVIAPQPGAELVMDYQIGKIGANPIDGFHFMGGFYGEQPVCNIPSKATRVPTSFRIVSTDQFFKGKYLLSLHLFPQHSTRYHEGKKGDWLMDECKKIEGPKCQKLSFLFVSLHFC